MAEPDRATEALNGVISWVKEQGEKQVQRTDSIWKTIIGLIVGAVAFFAVAYLVYRARRLGDKMAELEHEKDLLQAETTRKRAEVERELRKSAVEKLMNDYWAARKEAKKLQNSLKEVADKKASVEAEIDALENWDDVDRYLGRTAAPDTAGDSGAKAPPGQ